MSPHTSCWLIVSVPWPSPRWPQKAAEADQLNPRLFYLIDLLEALMDDDLNEPLANWLEFQWWDGETVFDWNNMRQWVSSAPIYTDDTNMQPIDREQEGVVVWGVRGEVATNIWGTVNQHKRKRVPECLKYEKGSGSVELYFP